MLWLKFHLLNTAFQYGFVLLPVEIFWIRCSCVHALRLPCAPMPMSKATSGDSLRRAALEACRAAAITCHAAAGLCRDANLGLQSVRAARCAEGLMRSAAAVASAAHAPDGKVDEGASKLEKEKKFEKAKGEKGNTKDLSKDKGTDDDDGMCVPPGPAQPRRRRRRDRALRAVAPPFVPAALADAELDDAWADEVAVSSSLAVSSWVVPPFIGPAADAARRPLIARRSSSRSPRRPSPERSSDAVDAAPVASALLQGRVATVEGLVSRPELDQGLVHLKEFDAKAGRWVCQLAGVSSCGSSLRSSSRFQKITSGFRSCDSMLGEER